MNAIININKIVLGAMLAATPFLTACGSAEHQALVPQSQAFAAEMAPATVCSSDCATTLLEPLHATIANGVLELTDERVFCSGTSPGSASAISVPFGETVTIAAHNLPYGCNVASRMPNGYFIVAEAAAAAPAKRGAAVPATPIDGPNILPAATGTLEFGQTGEIVLPSGKVAFYLAYCAGCARTN